MTSVLDVAAQWSFWQGSGRTIPVRVARDVALPQALDPRRAVVVQGVRRCGKSTLLQQMVGHYGLSPERCAFINFEDPRLASSLTWPVLDELVTQFRARHRSTASLTFFLDEIQWVDGWQRWLRTQLDKPGTNSFVITGSNAHLLSGELGSSLTGRHLTIELMPFSLQEAKRAKRSTSLRTWLTRGGFPEPFSSKDGDQLLRQYVDDIIERDVRERAGLRSTRSLRQVVQMVFESAGSELSMRRIAGAVGVAVETVQSWIEACRSAYLMFACPFFAYSERKRASHSQKFYPVDTGLRRVVVTKIGDDFGKHLECATFHALRARYGAVHYWRDARGEVDFVVVGDDGAPIPVQVTWQKKLPRHDEALAAFYEAFPQAAEPLLITKDTFETLTKSHPSRATVARRTETRGV